jgi:hypothetical protein
MTHFPQPNPQRRAPRVQLGGTVSAAIRRDDGHTLKGKLQTVSETGGLLRLASSLGEGDFVEILFQTRSGPVQGMAEMLAPRQTTTGWLQPFRYVALGDADHGNLRQAVETTLDTSFAGITSSSGATAGWKI